MTPFSSSNAPQGSSGRVNGESVGPCNEVPPIAGVHLPQADGLPPRLNEGASPMARRLKYAVEFYIPTPIKPGLPLRLFAKWRDPITQTVYEGLVSELQAAT